MTTIHTMKGTTMKNRLKSTARWIKENPDLTAMYALVGATIGGTTWITVAAIKADLKMIDEYNAEADRKNALIDDVYAKGNLPFLLSDGAIMSIPRDAPFDVLN